MAKPLGEKSKAIRRAIEANDGLGNAEIAALLNGHEDRRRDRLAFKAADIGNQRIALKKASGAPPARKKKRGRPVGAKAALPPAAAKPMAAAPSPIELIDRVFTLADDCGGIASLKRLVDRLAGTRG